MKTFTLLSIISLFASFCTAQVLVTKANTENTFPVVGTLPGSFAVSPTGAAMYSIPIELPAGRAGLLPALSLVYNSQSGSNILGQGWSLAGFSAITRANQTSYYNGQNKNIDFVNDELLLNGQHLIKVATDEYRMETDMATKILFIQSGEYGSYYKVFNKDGSIAEYGNSGNSRQICLHTNLVSDNNPIAWHINSLTDRTGKNTIYYKYEGTLSKGELHPSSIQYTGENGGISGENLITFCYNTAVPAPLHQTSYFENDTNLFVNQSTWLLTEILVTTGLPAGNNTFKHYLIDYYAQKGVCADYFISDISLVKRLIKDSQFSNVNIVNPTHFDWEFYQPKYVQGNFLANADYLKANSKVVNISLDLTGDNKDEIAVYKSKLEDTLQWNLYQNVISVYMNANIGNLEIPVIGSLRGNELHAIDWDANGDDELLFVDSEGIKIYDYDASITSLIKVFGNALSGKILIGDLTGDAINDIVVVNSNQCKLLLGNYNTTNNTFEYILNSNTLTVSSENQIQILGDFNGDASVELLFREFPDFKYKVYRFSTDAGFQLLPRFTTNIATFYSLSDQAAYYADFNGDGKTDICYIENDTVKHEFEKHTYFSIGSVFLQPQSPNEGNLNELPSFVEDFNNDGKADFINLSFGQELLLNLKFTMPDGFSWHACDTSVPMYIPADQFLNYITADRDGNGIRDIIVSARYNTVLGPGKLPSYDELVIAPFIDSGLGKNAIGSITNGFGVQTNINYTSFGSSGSLYANYPLSKPKFKDMVVSESYTLGEKEEKWDRNTYTFYTPVSHLTGKGFLGFKKTVFVSWQNNLCNTTLNEVMIKDNKYFQLYPASVTTHSMHEGVQNKLLSSTENILDFKIPDPEKLNFIPVYTQSVTKNWDNDAIHSYKGIVIQHQSVTDIDKYGNSSKTVSIMDETATSSEPTNPSWSKTTTTTFYTPSEIYWNIGLPETIEIKTAHHSNQVIDTYINSTKFHYYIKNSFLTPWLEYKEYFPNGNGTNLKTETWYTYDIYGNLTSETLKAINNGTSAERKVVYSYESGNGYNSRFLTSKTIKAETADKDIITTYNYDVLTGRLLSVTAPDNLISSSEYDIVGRVVKTTQADGTANQNILGWSSSITGFTPPEKALYYSLSFKSLVKNTENWGKTLTFYDKYSRPMVTITNGLNGEYKCVETRYDQLGRISQISEPFFSTDKPYQWTTYNYDDIGRVTTQMLPTGAIIQTDFSGLTTKVTNSATNVWKQTTVNVLGSPVEVKDPTEGTLSYQYYAFSKVRSIIAQGATTLYEYDDAGNQTQVIDPDAGKTAYTYNAFGELLTQTDARNNIHTLQYDNLGRLKTKSLMPDREISVYSYGESHSTSGFGQLLSIEKTLNDNKKIITSFTYDNFNRAATKSESIDGTIYTFAYGYDEASGLLLNYTYPTGYKIKYGYNAYGYMANITEDATSNQLWTATSANARGQLTDYISGNGLQTHREYDAYGFPASIATGEGIQLQLYSFDKFTGNLNWKKDVLNSLTENYEYDPLLKERLTSWQVNNGTKYGMQYSASGNVHTKSDVTQQTNGLYTYGASAGPHAVTGITQPTSTYLASAHNQSIDYNGFNKVKYIGSGNDGEMCEITYGTNSERIKSYTYEYLKSWGDEIQTKYYFDNFEVEIDHITKKTHYLHYISAGSEVVAIIEIKDGITTSPFYIHSDYQGTFNVITDGAGNKLETLAFDPWGRRRNPTTWGYAEVPTSFLFDRGYTGHQHLDRFGLINMNGRVYDPALARFLSPDPFIQNPSNSQNYNRYSYCLNNPLKYTDPSGYHQKPLDCDMQNPIIGGGGYMGSIANGTFRPYGQWSSPSSSGYSYDWGLGQYTNNGEVTSYTNVFNNVIRPNLGPLTGDLLAQFNKQMGFNEKAGSEKAFENKMKLLEARNVGYGKSFEGDMGEGDPPGGGKGYIISVFNGTAAYGYGATIDIGSVIDSYGNSNMYFTIGWTAGYGATAGMGMYGTNNGFKTSDLGGSAVDISFSFPIKIFGYRPFGGEFAGDWIYGGGLPGENTRVGGLNVGVGTGYFVNHTYTFIAPLPDNNFWCRPGRR